MPLCIVSFNIIRKCTVYYNHILVVADKHLYYGVFPVFVLIRLVVQCFEGFPCGSSRNTSPANTRKFSSCILQSLPDNSSVIHSVFPSAFPIIWKTLCNDRFS